MRTTVTLDADVAAAVDNLRRERGLGMSQALNEIARAGLVDRQSTPRIRLETRRMDLLIDVTNVAEALEIAEAATTTTPADQARQSTSR